jgi:Protein of unknown function (DUF3592)
MAQIIIFLIFGGFGSVMLYVGVTQYFRQRRLLRRATPVNATIVRSEVFSSKSADTDSRLQRDNSTTTHRPEVRFRYEVNGQTHESELLYPNIIVVTYASRESAAEALARYPVNANVRAFVDPSLPDQAYLIAEAGAGPVVFMIIGMLLPPVAWFVGKWV